MLPGKQYTTEILKENNRALPTLSAIRHKTRKNWIFYDVEQSRLKWRYIKTENGKGIQTVHPPLSARGGRGVEPPTKFKTGEGLTGPQPLKGGCWERVGWLFFSGGGGGRGVAIFK